MRCVLSLVGPLLVFAVVFQASGALAERQVLFVLDASRSMIERPDTSLFNKEIEAVVTSIGRLPTRTGVAVRLYGHRVGVSDRVASCRDTELYVPWTPAASSASIIKDHLEKVVPRGFSPIAFTLRQAIKDFNDQERAIVIVTDGKDTCGGDFEKAIAELAEQKIRPGLYIVALPGAQVETLDTHLLPLGGVVYNASSPDKLASSIGAAVQAAGLPGGVFHPDGDFNRDASSDQGAALAVSDGKLEGYIGAGDRADWYRFTAAAGDRFFVNLVPLGFGGGELSLRVVSKLLNEVPATRTSPGLGGAITSDVFTLEDSEEVFVQVVAPREYQLAKYTLEIKRLR